VHYALPWKLLRAHSGAFAELIGERKFTNGSRKVTAGDRRVVLRHEVRLLFGCQW